MVSQMKSKTKPPLYMADFERVFRTIHGVLLNEQCEPARSCLYFGIIGAAILHKHHGLSARPMVGAAGYNFGTPAIGVLAFAEPQRDAPHSSENAFHCWIEMNGWAIDFQAPLFSDLSSTVGLLLPVPRYMLQRQLQGASASLDELNRPNAYWYERNQLLEAQLFAGFIDKPVNNDLLNICVDWYKPHPKQMVECIGMGNNYGEVNPVRLSPLRLNGAW